MYTFVLLDMYWAIDRRLSVMQESSKRGSQVISKTCKPSWTRFSRYSVTRTAIAGHDLFCIVNRISETSTGAEQEARRSRLDLPAAVGIPAVQVVVWHSHPVAAGRNLAVVHLVAVHTAIGLGEADRSHPDLEVGHILAEERHSLAEERHHSRRPEEVSIPVQPARLSYRKTSRWHPEGA